MLFSTESPRKIWVFNRSIKRVIRTPTFGYGMPANDTDGLRTVDEFELYNGAPDMYEWTLLGKKELLVPYNSYRIHSSDIGHNEILQKKHVNPDLARFELHRVWMVEGRLKPDMRHIYSRRILYLDEDSWQVSASDSYDLEGNLWIADARPFGDERNRWTVFGIDYRVLGVVDTPPDFVVHEIGGDYLLGSVREDDREHVKVYRLVKPG